MVVRPKARPASPMPGKDEALDVQRRHVLLAHIGDEVGGEDHAKHADRDVDPEDPAPRGIGGDEAAERGPDHRSEQGRDGEPGQSRDQFRLGHGAQDDEPAHRHHHGASHALQDAVEDELGQRLGKAAQRRAQGKDDDRRAEHGARPEAIGDPAAQWDEHGERQEIGRERELERDGVLAHVRRDGRERGRDHRRVHGLHEQGDGDDERDEIAGHVAGVRGKISRDMGRASP